MAVDLSRRQFLKGTPPLPVRPPWACAEPQFLQRCDRCGLCLQHCPQNILEKDRGGYPRVNFRRGGCTFCGLCLEPCRTQALVAPATSSPWQLRLQLAPFCLNRCGTVCRSCGEHCEASAIRFRPAAGGSLQVEVREEHCSGCGQCVSVCPVGAVSLIRSTVAVAQDESYQEATAGAKIATAR